MMNNGTLSMAGLQAHFAWQHVFVLVGWTEAGRLQWQGVSGRQMDDFSRPVGWKPSPWEQGTSSGRELHGMAGFSSSMDSGTLLKKKEGIFVHGVASGTGRRYPCLMSSACHASASHSPGHHMPCDMPL